MYYWIFFVASFFPFAAIAHKSKNMTAKQATLLFVISLIVGGAVTGAIALVEYLIA